MIGFDALPSAMMRPDWVTIPLRGILQLFVSDYTGEIVAEFGETEEGALIHTLNIAEARKFRAGMGFFRDRRPELYGPLLTLDGVTRRG